MPDQNISKPSGSTLGLPNFLVGGQVSGGALPNPNITDPKAANYWNPFSDPFFTGNNPSNTPSNAPSGSSYTKPAGWSDAQWQAWQGQVHGPSTPTPTTPTTQPYSYPTGGGTGTGTGGSTVPSSVQNFSTDWFNNYLQSMGYGGGTPAGGTGQFQSIGFNQPQGGQPDWLTNYLQYIGQP